jgi:DNA-binding MarR family transcriptional regulator
MKDFSIDNFLELRRNMLTAGRRFNSLLAKINLSVEQYQVLRAADQNSAVSIPFLCTNTGAERTTVSRGLRLLQRCGLIKEEDSCSPRTRSHKKFSLTSEGSKKIKQASKLLAH